TSGKRDRRKRRGRCSTNRRSKDRAPGANRFSFIARSHQGALGGGGASGDLPAWTKAETTAARLGGGQRARRASSSANAEWTALLHRSPFYCFPLSTLSSRLRNSS